MLVDLEVFYLGHLKNFYTIQCTSYNWHINLTPALIDKCTADVNTIAKILQCCVPRNTSSEQSVDYKQRSKTVYFAMSKHQKQSKKKFTVVTGSWFDSVSGCCLSSLIWNTSPRLPLSWVVAMELASSFGGFELNLPPSPRTRFMACRWRDSWRYFWITATYIMHIHLWPLSPPSPFQQLFYMWIWVSQSHLSFPSLILKMYHWAWNHM